LDRDFTEIKKLQNTRELQINGADNPGPSEQMTGEGFLRIFGKRKDSKSGQWNTL
jgi:hypothetical protein